MSHRSVLKFVILTLAVATATSMPFQANADSPNNGRPQANTGKTTKKSSPQPRRQRNQTGSINPDLPMVLILGDSISIGYTKPLREMLGDQANIIHNPGNSQGTTHTLTRIDEWLAMHDWDVIHFNLGLHDLKRVKVAGTSENSNDPSDPYQADLETYADNFEKIINKLAATDAKLIFATTTPFPEGVRPHRDPEDAASYNQAALGVIKRHGITVNDLYAFVLPKLDKLQKPKNVHFTAEGSKAMAKEVARYVTEALDALP